MALYKFFSCKGKKIEICQGDITQQKDVEAIVNAANPTLLGGGGVDGAIHRAAGPELREECRAIPEVSPGVRCPTGEVRLTKGYRLPVPYVIHTVGPVYQRDGEKAPELLRSCYVKAIQLAREKNLHSLAFPSISTGAYGYHIKEAAEVALNAICDELSSHPEAPPHLVRMVLFSEEDFHVYAKVLDQIIQRKGES